MEVVKVVVAPHNSDHCNVDIRSNMNQLKNAERTLVLLGLEGVGINIFQPECRQSHGIARLK